MGAYNVGSRTRKGPRAEAPARSPTESGWNIMEHYGTLTAPAQYESALISYESMSHKRPTFVHIVS